MEKVIISCDWFQVTCTRDARQCISEGMFVQGTHKTDEGKLLIYECVRSKEFNALFGNCVGIALHNFTLATIMCEPRVSTLNKSICLIKLANPLLYSARWCWYLIDIMSALKWKFHNISRVDVCADFNYFKGHLDPREFIRRFLRSGQYDPENPSYYRVGSNKYATIGKKSVSKQLVGGLSEVFCAHMSEYLRFGGRSSGVCVYLYNKTKELNDKHGKHYIRDLWRRSGLEDSEDCPVFRLELSILPNSMNLRNVGDVDEQSEREMAKGLKQRQIGRWNVRSLAMDDFGSQQKVEEVFWAYASKFFRFKEVGRQLYKHNWPDVDLFDVNFSPQVKPFRISRPLDSGVSERNAASCIQRLLYLSTNLDIVDKVTLYNAIGILERQGAFKTKEITDEKVIEIAELLKKGYSWAELGKMNIASVGQIETMREVIHQSAVRELRGYLCDADIARAIDQYDATTEAMKELAKLNYDDYDNAE